MGFLFVDADPARAHDGCQNGVENGRKKNTGKTKGAKQPEKSFRRTTFSPIVFKYYRNHEVSFRRPSVVSENRVITGYVPFPFWYQKRVRDFFFLGG